MIYFHRYLRLTPVFAVAIFFTITLMRFLGSGPLWPFAISNIAAKCEKYWWAALLYINNYIREGGMVKFTFTKCFEFKIMILFTFCCSVFHILGF